MIKSGIIVALVALVSVSSALPASQFDVGARRIVNGTATTIQTIPFQVSILFYNSQWCGGSILDSTTILTAAHCFDWYFDLLYDTTAWTVRAGSSYWSTGGQLVGISSITGHENYDPVTYNYDIAILKLATPLVYTNSIQPVVLPTASNTLADGQSVQVSGWGRLTVSERNLV